MAEAKQKSLDFRNAALMCLLANINRDPKKKTTPFKPADFMPEYGEKKKPPKGTFSDLKSAFIREK